MVGGVHGGDDGQEHLRGADVAGGLLAADMLLAGGQRQPVALLAIGIDRHTAQAAGHDALVLVARGEEGGVWPAIAHRHAEALAAAQGHVRPPLARRRQQHQSQ